MQIYTVFNLESQNLVYYFMTNQNFTLNLSCTVESGAQAFARLVKPPSIVPLHPKLLPNAPKPSEIIEIIYDRDSPHTILVSDIISNVILPAEFGGKDADVIILHTDGQFSIHTLIKSMMKKIKEANESTDLLLKRLLKRVHVVSIYDSQHMYVAIHALETMLAEHANVALVVIDSVMAFYWSDRMFGSGILKINSYVLNILQLVRAVTIDYQTVIMYTKPINSFAKNEDCGDKSDLKISHKLCLKSRENEKDRFTVSVNSYGIVNTYNIVYNNHEICVF